MNKKKIIFTIIMLLPLGFLVLILSHFFYLGIYPSVVYFRVGILEHIEPISEHEVKEVTFREELISISEEDFKEIPSYLPIFFNNDSIIVTNRNSAGRYQAGEVPYYYDNESFVLYVYGGSSVVAPSQDEVFISYAAEELNNKNLSQKVIAINFGQDAANSKEIVERVYSSLRHKDAIRPDIIVIYSGHNDYFGSPGYGDVIQKSSVVKNTFFIKNFIELFERMEFKNYVFDEGSSNPDDFVYTPGFITNIDWVIEPEVKQFFINTGLASYDMDFFKTINNFILKEYANNIYSVIGLTQSLEIPVIILTPISNLEAKPYGPDLKNNLLYKRGMKETNYSKRIAYLREAKDNEILSQNIRAKSELLDFIRSINTIGVYIIDLERKLEEKGFGFGYEDFYDYVHMRNTTHKLIGEIIANKIIEHDVLG